MEHPVLLAVLMVAALLSSWPWKTPCRVSIHEFNREKCGAHTKGTTGNTMMQKSEKLQNGIAERKQQSNLHTQVTYQYPKWLFGCPAWGTDTNSTQQLRYVGIQ